MNVMSLSGFTPLALPLQIGIVALVVTAAVYDYRWRRIPNWLTGSGAAAGLALNLALFGIAGLGGAVKAFCYGFGIYFGLYLLRAMGAGDVKLMAAVSSMAGPERWLAIFLVTSLIGGVTAVLFATLRGRLSRTLWNVAFIFSQLSKLQNPAMAREELDVSSPTAMTLPAGVRIAAGVVAFITITALRMA